MADKQMQPGKDQGKMPSKDAPTDKGGGKAPDNGMPGKK